MAIGEIQNNRYTPVNATGRTASSAGSADAVFSSLLKNAAASPESAKITAYDSIFQRAAEQYGVPVNLLKAVAKAESNYNPNAVSRCGALGVMQLMPSTAAGLGVSNPLDAEQNIMGGAKYLSDKLKQYDGSVELALAAYNAGSGNVAKYGGVPPFEETQNYISKVMDYAGLETGASVSASSGLSELANSLSGSSSLTDLYALSMLGNTGGSSSGLTGLNSLLGLGGSSSGAGSLPALSSLLGDSSSLTSLYALSLLGNGSGSSGTSSENSLNGLLGSSGTGSLSSQNYLSLIQLIAAQMQLGSSQPLASDLSGLISSGSGSML